MVLGTLVDNVKLLVEEADALAQVLARSRYLVVKGRESKLIAMVVEHDGVSALGWSAHCLIELGAYFDHLSNDGSLLVVGEYVHG